MSDPEVRQHWAALGLTTVGIAAAGVLTSVKCPEQAFKEIKNDLSLRPIDHERDERIEAHNFVAFLVYCLQVTLKARLRLLRPTVCQRVRRFGGEALARGWCIRRLQPDFEAIICKPWP